MSASLTDLPRWDLSNVFSGLEGEDYRTAFARLESLIAADERFYDERNIRRLTAQSTNVGATNAAPTNVAEVAAADLLADILRRANEAARLAETLDSFIYSYLSTDSYDAAAMRETSRLELLETRRQKLAVRLKGWLGAHAAALPASIAARPELATHRFFLEHSARASQRLMSEELESLASDLCLDGGGAFGKLQGNVTSQLKVPFSRDGREELLPITVVRNLCFDPDPAVRESAYHAELKGWDSIRTTVAAALNSVKGTALTLARRRGWNSVLDADLEQNRIDRPTLDALLGAIREFFPVFRRYLSAKARKLGKARLAWWDIFAPVGSSHTVYDWPRAEQFIVERFSSFSADMGAFARRAFAQRWIDAAPRDGKRGGAFCMPIVGCDESRILMNFDGSLEQVSTLAHELGHGYHNDCQTGLEPLRRGAPSTLAETASIFCETLVAESTLAAAGPAEQLAILEAQLCGATQVCVDISSRFLFESAFFERRRGSELSPDEICGLMLAAQRDTYADAVDPATYHRYMWLWKPHYYAHAANFYNFPYAFGHLFALGLYAIFRREGATFVPRYRELLRDTAQDYAAPLARRFGIDISTREFWRESLRIIEDQVTRYEALPS